MVVIKIKGKEKHVCDTCRKRKWEPGVQDYFKMI